MKKKKKKKKDLKKEIAIIAIPVFILAGVVLAVVFTNYEADKELASEKLKGLDFYSEQEISFLKKEGFLTASVVEKIAESKQGTTKEEVAKVLKSPTLVEQNLNSTEEHFEVLATQLDINNNVYKMAFKLENKSQEQKNFFLIPVSHENQAIFKGIRGLVTDVSNAQVVPQSTEVEGIQLLARLYDVNQHKSELKTELAQAYDDIEQNNYQAQAIEVAIKPMSAVIAQSEWGVGGERSQQEDLFESVYLLVYGSAGGAKDNLTILNVHSHPQQGENWEIDFVTRGKADLYIIPNDRATVRDDEFVSLTCDSREKSPQILEGDTVYYPDWFCNGIGKVVHFTKKAGKHTLKFIFGEQTRYAYNNPGWTVDGLDYTTRRKLTIDHDKIDADLTDLPVLVKLTDATFDFDKDNDDGFDIRFTEDDGETLLKFERERHTDPNAEYWVKVGSVTSASDTDFYIYYRTTDTADGADPTNVWDTNYMMVQHLKDLTTSTTEDSTSNNNDGTKKGVNEPIEADGKIAKAQDFEVTDDYIDCGDIDAIDGVSKLTLSAWVRVDSPTVDGARILYKYSTWESVIQIQCHVTSGHARMTVDMTTHEGQTADSIWVVGTFYHWAMVFDGTQSGNENRLKFYLNDEQKTLTFESTIPSTTANNAASFLIGDAGDFDGIIDEVRITNDPRTAAEVKADYNSGNDSLLTYGGEEAPSNTAPTITSVEDGPDPIEVGQTINFSVDWNDVDTEGIKMLICKSNAITAATPSCDGGEWCSDKNDYDSTDPIPCTYVIQSGDVGTQNYYAFVCDDEPTCSSSTSGTFTAKAASTGSLRIQGGTQIHGGVRFGD